MDTNRISYTQTFLTLKISRVTNKRYLICKRNLLDLQLSVPSLKNDYIPTGLPGVAEGGCDDGIALEGLSKSRMDS